MEASIYARPSAKNSRLKPASSNPLESIGLPSKGDTRLLDFKAQESYYELIQSRYEKLCLSAGGKNGNDADLFIHAFSSLQISSATESIPNLGFPASESSSVSKDLWTVLFAMRKLREGLVASGRHDSFARNCFVFVTRVGILAGHSESYVPALNRLLRFFHVHCPLSEAEHQEFSIYIILDQACRINDLASAFSERAILLGNATQGPEVQSTEIPGMERSRAELLLVDELLFALARGEWLMFWRLKDRASPHQQALLRWADDRVRVHALRCIGKSYLSIDRRFLEISAGDRSWDDLKAKDRATWDLAEDGNTIIIRKVKSK